MFNEFRINKLDKAIRFLILASTLTCLLVPLLSDLHYTLQSYCLILILAAGFFCSQIISNYYRSKRNEEKIANIIRGISEIIIYSFILGVLSYCVCYIGFELKTDFILSMDKAVGFNWLQHYETVKNSPSLHKILILSYLSMFPQCVFAILFFSLAGNNLLSRIFVNSFVLLALSAIFISTFMPSAEVDIVWGLTKPSQIGLKWVVEGGLPAEHLLNLNNKTMKEIPLSNLQGIICFPSFHTMVGIILIVCMSHSKWLCFPSFVLNTLLIAATPSVGGHYLVDTLAGAIIALLGMAVILKFVQPGVPLFSKWWTLKAWSNIAEPQKI